MHLSRLQLLVACSLSLCSNAKPSPFDLRLDSDASNHIIRESPSQHLDTRHEREQHAPFHHISPRAADPFDLFGSAKSTIGDLTGKVKAAASTFTTKKNNVVAAIKAPPTAQVVKPTNQLIGTNALPVANRPLVVAPKALVLPATQAGSPANPIQQVKPLAAGSASPVFHPVNPLLVGAATPVTSPTTQAKGVTPVLLPINKASPPPLVPVNLVPSTVPSVVPLASSPLGIKSPLILAGPPSKSPPALSPVAIKPSPIKPSPSPSPIKPSTLPSPSVKPSTALAQENAVPVNKAGTSAKPSLALASSTITPSKAVIAANADGSNIQIQETGGEPPFKLKNAINIQPVDDTTTGRNLDTLKEGVSPGKPSPTVKAGEAPKAKPTPNPTADSVKPSPTVNPASGLKAGADPTKLSPSPPLSNSPDLSATKEIDGKTPTKPAFGDAPNEAGSAAKPSSSPTTPKTGDSPASKDNPSADRTRGALAADKNGAKLDDTGTESPSLSGANLAVVPNGGGLDGTDSPTTVSKDGKKPSEKVPSSPLGPSQSPGAAPSSLPVASKDPPLGSKSLTPGTLGTSSQKGPKDGSPGSESLAPGSSAPKDPSLGPLTAESLTPGSSAQKDPKAVPSSFTPTRLDGSSLTPSDPTKPSDSSNPTNPTKLSLAKESSNPAEASPLPGGGSGKLQLASDSSDAPIKSTTLLDESFPLDKSDKSEKSGKTGKTGKTPLLKDAAFHSTSPETTPPRASLGTDASALGPSAGSSKQKSKSSLGGASGDLTGGSSGGGASDLLGGPGASPLSTLPKHSSKSSGIDPFGGAGASDPSVLGTTSASKPKSKSGLGGGSDFSLGGGALDLGGGSGTGTGTKSGLGGGSDPSLGGGALGLGADSGIGRSESSLGDSPLGSDPLGGGSGAGAGAGAGAPTSEQRLTPASLTRPVDASANSLSTTTGTTSAASGSGDQWTPANVVQAISALGSALASLFGKGGSSPSSDSSLTASASTGGSKRHGSSGGLDPTESSAGGSGLDTTTGAGLDTTGLGTKSGKLSSLDPTGAGAGSKTGLELASTEAGSLPGSDPAGTGLGLSKSALGSESDPTGSGLGVTGAGGSGSQDPFGGASTSKKTGYQPASYGGLGETGLGALSGAGGSGKSSGLSTTSRSKPKHSSLTGTDGSDFSSALTPSTLSGTALPKMSSSRSGLSTGAGGDLPSDTTGLDPSSALPPSTPSGSRKLTSSSTRSSSSLSRSGMLGSPGLGDSGTGDLSGAGASGLGAAGGRSKTLSAGASLDDPTDTTGAGSASTLATGSLPKRPSAGLGDPTDTSGAGSPSTLALGGLTKPPSALGAGLDDSTDTTGAGSSSTLATAGRRKPSALNTGTDSGSEATASNLGGDGALSGPGATKVGYQNARYDPSGGLGASTLGADLPGAVGSDPSATGGTLDTSTAAGSRQSTLDPTGDTSTAAAGSGLSTSASSAGGLEGTSGSPLFNGNSQNQAAPISNSVVGPCPATRRLVRRFLYDSVPPGKYCLQVQPVTAPLQVSTIYSPSQPNTPLKPQLFFHTGNVVQQLQSGALYSDNGIIPHTIPQATPVYYQPLGTVTDPSVWNNAALAQSQSPDGSGASLASTLMNLLASLGIVSNPSPPQPYAQNQQAVALVPVSSGAGQLQNQQAVQLVPLSSGANPTQVQYVPVTQSAAPQYYTIPGGDGTPLELVAAPSSSLQPVQYVPQGLTQLVGTGSGSSGPSTLNALKAGTPDDTQSLDGTPGSLDPNNSGDTTGSPDTKNSDSSLYPKKLAASSDDPDKSDPNLSTARNSPGLGKIDSPTAGESPSLQPASFNPDAKLILDDGTSKPSTIPDDPSAPGKSSEDAPTDGETKAPGDPGQVNNSDPAVSGDNSTAGGSKPTPIASATPNKDDPATIPDAKTPSTPDAKAPGADITPPTLGTPSEGSA
ncbi:MAG: hypothetical protein M1829_004949 [Trizodia sp. TS-e1964]|nr:MAG: hypothetical protein M1829_004949 [Trizodia sp. TS-e1964]